MEGRTYIGISGWRYAGWRGKFYSKGLAQRRELQYVSEKLNSVEINGSFYSLQRPESYRLWYDQTPPGFIFSVKGGRFITHMLKLRNAEAAIANFFASGVLALGEKLGPILWQFPPQFGCNIDRFQEFFQLLPRTGDQAEELAARHNEKLAGRSWTTAKGVRTIRHAVEVRHASFLCPEFVQLLCAHNVALVFADTAQKFMYSEDLTADFVYVRLHGDLELYASGYSEAALEWWANRVLAWRSGGQPPDAALTLPAPKPKRRARDVYVYFDNDAKVHAPFDAMNLASRLGVQPFAHAA